MNKSSLQSNVNKLTAHVLVSLKMGALCNADTTAMTAWRLFMSHSFWEVSQHMLSRGYHANILGNRTPAVCVGLFTLAVRMYRLNTSALIFNVCAWRISRTTQKLV